VSGPTSSDSLAVSVDEPEQMRRLGAGLASLAQPGDLIILAGPLGAGKTVLAQGIAAGLGVTGRVTSPTFVLAREYRDGRIPLLHVDAYRLTSVLDLEDLDLDTDAGLTLIEWGVGMAEGLTAEHLLIEISRHPEDEQRDLQLRPAGESWQRRLAVLRLES
jgi:tRNA threonylcarbamoyladenosine biosynthesis protein TsaE